MTTVNGETADWDKDQAWWCLTDATGEMTTVGVADIALHDGDSYAFIYTLEKASCKTHPGTALVLVTALCLMGALLVVSKQAMSGLPNIEPVTLLVILFALELPTASSARGR